jgi:accessory colonization factor AcfC
MDGALAQHDSVRRENARTTVSVCYRPGYNERRVEIDIAAAKAPAWHPNAKNTADLLYDISAITASYLMRLKFTRLLSHNHQHPVSRRSE